MNQIAIDNGMAYVIHNFGTTDLTMTGPNDDNHADLYRLYLDEDKKAVLMDVDGEYFDCILLDPNNELSTLDELMFRFHDKILSILESLCADCKYVYVVDKNNNFLHLKDVTNV